MTLEDKNTPHHFHDRGYKMLLSFRKIFRYLIQDYIPVASLQKLDYDKSEKLDSSFILTSLAKEESDVLYRVPLSNKKEIYLFILIEQQSTVDYSMPFRIMCYLSDVWRYVYNNTDEKIRRQKSFRWPPVFPIVLYNGAEAWTAELEMRDLVEDAERFGVYIPNVKYYLIDIPRYDLDKLRKIKNALAGVFMLEHEAKGQEVEEILRDGLALINQEKDYQLWMEIVSWAKGKLKRDWPAQASPILDQIDFEKHSREEITSMLETLPKKIMALGEQKGEKKGEQKGRQQGIRESILDFLQERFGGNLSGVQKKLEAVTSDDVLTKLRKSAFKSSSLEEFKKALAEVAEK